MLGKLAIVVKLVPFDSSFERKGALVTVQMCPPWSVILKSV